MDDTDAQYRGDTDQMSANLGATLRAALAPETDVRNNARRKVDRALHVRSATALLASMGGCGVETMRHLLTNPLRGADRYPMSEIDPLPGSDIDADSATPDADPGNEERGHSGHDDPGGAR